MRVTVNMPVGEYDGDYEAVGSQHLPTLVPAVAVIRGVRALGVVTRRKGPVGHKGVSGVPLRLPLGVKSTGLAAGDRKIPRYADTPSLNGESVGSK